MMHTENDLLKKYPAISKIVGFIILVLVFYCVWEWNNVTDSYWGFVYLVIAVPGVFVSLFKVLKNIKSRTPHVGKSDKTD